jgi:hypothetical protein
MHMTIHRFRHRPEEAVEDFLGAVEPLLFEDDQPAGTCVLGRLDGPEGAVLAFWPAEPAATAAATWSAGQPPWLDARAYAVTGGGPGRAAGITARLAFTGWFDTAGDSARAEAADRAGRERIDPVVRVQDGVVAAYGLRAADDTVGFLVLGTDVTVPEKVRRAALRTTLLPGEDPALLSGPDRVDLHRVLSVRLPEAVRS